MIFLYQKYLNEVCKRTLYTSCKNYDSKDSFIRRWIIDRI